jgi:pimeloyl-ACP methyl ester carboxylesterase
MTNGNHRTFILVHGAFHGAWCWERVTPLLAQAGYEAIAIDLPGHGGDKTPLSQVSMRAYIQRIGRAVQETAAQENSVVLVGHSMGGMVIAQVADMFPNEIQHLVYLSAFMPRNGESVLALGNSDSASLMPRSMRIDQDHGIAVIPNEAAGELFYNDCTPQDVALAAARLTPQSLQPFAVPAVISGKANHIPRTFIECSQDHAIGLDMQRRMQANHAPVAQITLAASHSPFWSMPQETAQAIVAAVGQGQE